MLANEALFDQLVDILLANFGDHIKLIHIADPVSPVQMFYLA